MVTAFSRESDDKVYVQHRLKQNSAEVYSLLKEGASVYVCGDAARMAKDVHRVLAEILAEGQGVEREQGEVILKEMRATGRYQVRCQPCFPLTSSFYSCLCTLTDFILL